MLSTFGLLADSGRGVCFPLPAAGERVTRGLATPRFGPGLPATSPALSLLRRVETLATAALAGIGELALEARALLGGPLFGDAGLVSLGDAGLLVLADGFCTGVLRGAGLLRREEGVVAGPGEGGLAGEGALLGVEALLARGEGTLPGTGEGALPTTGEGGLLTLGEAGLLGGREGFLEEPREVPGVALAAVVGVVVPSCDPVEWRRWRPRTGARGVVLGDCEKGTQGSLVHGTSTKFPGTIHLATGEWHSRQTKRNWIVQYRDCGKTWILGERPCGEKCLKEWYMFKRKICSTSSSQPM